MAESFFASLACELIVRRSWKTKNEARLAVFTWIEGWYAPKEVLLEDNPRRRQSGLGQMSPINFGMKEQEKTVQNSEITLTIITLIPFHKWTEIKTSNVSVESRQFQLQSTLQHRTQVACLIATDIRTLPVSPDADRPAGPIP